MLIFEEGGKPETLGARARTNNKLNLQISDCKAAHSIDFPLPDTWLLYGLIAVRCLMSKMIEHGNNNNYSSDSMDMQLNLHYNNLKQPVSTSGCSGHSTDFFQQPPLHNGNNYQNSSQLPNYLLDNGQFVNMTECIQKSHSLMIHFVHPYSLFLLSYT